MQLMIVLCVGGPASGKSTWAKKKVAEDPLNWCRISNDDLRNMCNGYVFSSDYEKFITDTRNFLIREALKRDKNVIIDNVNSNKRHWEMACKLAQEANKDVMVMEKHFFEDLETLLERNAKREGTARVPDEAVKRFFKELGGVQFKLANPKKEIFVKRNKAAERFVEPMKQDPSLPKCCIFDLDGTMCNIAHRNPYDASRCDKDSPNQHVVELCQLMHENGHQIFFFSGRDDIHMEMTKGWLDLHFGYPYQLHMRETGNKEDDRSLKERMFNTHIKDKFNCKMWVDDRRKVCQFVHESGLPLFRVGDPDATF
jgi:predicted kinase